MYYAFIYSLGSEWDSSMQDPVDQVSDHIKYMESVSKAGKLVIGGPFTDGSGGLAVIDVGSDAEARSIAEQDPAVLQQILTVDVRPWDASMERQEP